MLHFFFIVEMFGPDWRAPTQADGEMDAIIDLDPIEETVENNDELAENDFDDGNQDAQFAENHEVIEENHEIVIGLARIAYEYGDQADNLDEHEEMNEETDGNGDKLVVEREDLHFGPEENHDQPNQSAHIFSSTNFSQATFGNSGSFGLSDLSLNFDVSSGTQRIIQQQLHEAGMNLDAFDEQNLQPAAPNQAVQLQEIPDSHLSPGPIAPNISNPENTLDSEDRELITIYHTM